MLLEFLGGLLSGAIAKVVTFFSLWFIGKHEGRIAQRQDDLEATQKAEQEAADARNRADTDPGYAERVRDRYTDSGDQ